MAKYDPLEMHLLCLPASQNAITLSFAQVESIIEDGLTKSAYSHRVWWGNEKDRRHHTQARAWTTIGWQVAAVDLGQRWVRFGR